MFNKIMKTLLLGTLILIAGISGNLIYNAQERSTHIIDDIHNIDWSTISVGDNVEVSPQHLNRWKDYIQDDATREGDMINYLPETDEYYFYDEEGGEPVIEPKYELNLQDELYFGVTFDSDKPGEYYDLFSTNGLIQLITRPYYERVNDSIWWSNSGTNENSWYVAKDKNGLMRLQYKADGSFLDKTSASFARRNTFTVHLEPDSKTATFALCYLPDTNTSANCGDTQATSRVAISSVIKDKYLNNKFLTMRIYGGIDSGLIVKNIDTYASIISYSDIISDEIIYYVPLGTTLDEVHDLIAPRFYEFIDGVVTQIGTPVPMSDMVSDGGYDAVTSATYDITYQTDNGYAEGSKTSNAFKVQVLSEDEMIDMHANDFTVELENAPTTRADIITLMGATAHEGETDFSDHIYINALDGYNLDNPKVGSYEISFAVEGSYGHTIYDKGTLKVTQEANLDQVYVTEEIVKDENGDNQLTVGETITYEVIITNNSNVNLNDSMVDYFVNNNYYDVSTISNIEMSTGAKAEVNTETGRINITFDQFQPGDVTTLTYDVTAKDVWYIYNDEQYVDRFSNLAQLYIRGDIVDFRFETLIEDAMYNGFFNYFSLEDSSGDDLITPNEEVYVEHTFFNDSDYSLFTVEFNNEDTVDKLTQDYAIDLVVTSDKRELVKDVDYNVVGEEQVFVDHIVPRETITVTYTALSTDTFHNSNDLKMKVHGNIWLEDRTNLYSSEELVGSIPIDIESVLDYSISGEWLDTDDHMADPGEELVLAITISNTGQLDINKPSVTLTLDDYNIVEEALTSDMISIQNTDLKTEHELKSARSSFSLNGNKINLNSLIAGTSKTVFIKLNVKDTIKTTEYVQAENQVGLGINDLVTVSSSLIGDHELEPFIPIDKVEHVSYDKEVEVIETIGDGDSKIDPGETFDYVVTLTNSGKIDLDRMDIYSQLDNNFAFDYGDFTVDYEYYVNGELSEDFTLYEDVENDEYYIETGHFHCGDVITIKHTVTYGNSVADYFTENSFVMEHPYMSTVTIDSDVLIDFESHRDITFDVYTDKTSVKPGDTIYYDVKIINNGLTRERDFSLTIDGDAYNLNISNIHDLVLTNSLGESLVYGEDYTANNFQIFFNELKPNDFIELQLELDINYPMYINPTEGSDYIIKTTGLFETFDGVQHLEEVDFTPDLSDSELVFETTLEPADGSDTIEPGELLDYTFKLTNTDDVNLTNVVLDFDLTDLGNISDLEFSVNSDDSDLGYNVDLSTNIVTFTSLDAGKYVELTGSSYVDTYFDTSDTIDLSYTFESDFFAQDEHMDSVVKNPEPGTKVLLTSELKSTSSGNMYVGPDEQVYVDLVVTNIGSVDIGDLEFVIDESAEDFESVNVVQIIDQDGNAIDSSHYSISSNDGDFPITLFLDELPVGKSYTISLEVNSNHSLEYSDDLYLITHLTSTYLDLEEITPLQLDLTQFGDLSIELEIIKNIGDGDDVLDPSETFVAQTSITNTGALNIDDIVISDVYDDINLEDSGLGFDVVISYDDGATTEEFTDYTVEGNHITINSVPGYSTITIQETIKAVDAFYPAAEAQIVANYNFTHPSYGPMNYDVTRKIGLDYINNASIDTLFTITNDNGNAAVLPGDKVLMNYEITNDGATVLSNYPISNKLDAYILNNSIKVDSATIDDVDAISDFSLNGSTISIKELKPGQTAKFTLSGKLDDQFGTNDKITNTISYTFYTFTEEVYSQQVSINVDRSGITDATASIEVVGSGTGDRDGLADPNELLLATLRVSNPNNMALGETVIDYSEYSDNIAYLDNVSSSGVVDLENETVTFESIPANSNAVVTYASRYKSKFNADDKAYYFNNATVDGVALTPAETYWDIDTKANTNLSASLKISDDSGNNLATTGETLHVTYELKNIGNRAVSNVSISDLTDDRNIDDTIFNQIVTIDGVEQTLNYTDGVYTIDYLGANQTLLITFDVNTETIFTRGLLKFIWFNLGIDFNATDDINTFDIDSRVTIEVDPNVSNLTVTSNYVDTDGDKLVDPDETSYYEIKIENTGSINLENVLVNKNRTGISMIAGDLEVYDGDMNELVLGTDYNAVPTGIAIKDIQPSSSVIFRYNTTAPSILTENTALNYATTISHNEISNINVYDSYEIDTEHIRSTTEVMQIAGQPGMTDMESLVGKDFKGEIILTNNGQLNERDTEVFVTETSENIDIDYLSFTVTRNGSDYTSSVYFDGLFTGGLHLVIPTMNVGDVIKITIDAHLSDNIIDPFTDPEVIDVRVASDIHYDADTIKSPEFVGTINIDEIKDTNFNITTTEYTIDNNLANTNEKMKTVIEIQNNGSLQVEDFVMDVDFDYNNAVVDSIVLESVKFEDGKNVLPTRYSWDGEYLTLDQVRGNKSIFVTFSYETKSQVELTYGTRILDTYLIDSVSATNVYGDVYDPVNSSLKYDNSESSTDIDVTYIGEDMELSPGDIFSAKFVGVNNGTVHEEDVYVSVDNTNSGIDYSTLSKIELYRNGTPMTASEFTHLADKHAVLVNDFYPGDVIVGYIDYSVDENPRDIEEIMFSATMIDPFDQEIRRYADPFPVLDLSDLTKYTLKDQISYVDSNGNGYLNAGEEVTYVVTIDNSLGEIEYMNILIQSNFGDINVNTADITKTVTNTTGDQYYELDSKTDDMIKLSVVDVLPGDVVDITYNFTVTEDMANYTLSTDSVSSQDTQSVTSRVMGVESIIDNNVDIASPYINALDYVSVDEETTLSQMDILNILEVETNEIHLDAIERNFMIDYDIDFSTPGLYDVTMTLTDRDDTDNYVTQVSTIEVLDLLPIITSKDYLAVSKGEPIVDYMSDLDVVASEISTGDLDVLVDFDDSKVDYNTVGSYVASLSVSDEEGNVATKDVEIEVFNSLYPLVSSRDAFMTIEEASAITSLEQLAQEVDAYAIDYDYTDVTDQIVYEDVDGFLTSTYTSGDEFMINLSYTNELGYSDSVVSKITISDSDYNIEIESNTPIAIKLGDDASLAKISELSEVTVSLYSGDTKLGEVVLDESNVIYSNVDPTKIGFYQVKYHYFDLTTALEATYIQEVFISDDGYMLDNDDVVFDLNIDNDVIMPGDTISGDIKITNGAHRDKLVNYLTLISDNENTKSFENVVIKDANNNVIDVMGITPYSTGASYTLNNLELESGMSYNIDFDLTTNDLFTFTNEFSIAKEVDLEGEEIVTSSNASVNPDAIKLSADVSFDKDSYSLNDEGLLTVTLINSGTMDSDVHLIDLVSSLVNATIEYVYVDGIEVFDATNIYVPAQGSVDIKIKFSVNGELFLGDDLIKFLDEFGHEAIIKLPIDTTVITEDIDEGNNTSDNDDIKTLDTGFVYNLIPVIIVISLLTALITLRKFIKKID